MTPGYTRAFAKESWTPRRIDDSRWGLFLCPPTCTSMVKTEIWGVLDQVWAQG